MKKTLLALCGLLENEMRQLEQMFDVVRLRRGQDPEGELKRIQNDVVAVLSSTNTKVGRSLIEALPNLEIIAQFAVGTDNIDLKAAEERHVKVVNTPDVLTNDTADLALGLLLATARRLVEGDVYVRVGKWLNGPMPLSTSLNGKKAGIVGMGRIGRAIAKRCAAFDMEVSYTARNQKSDLDHLFFPDVLSLAEASDFLVLACSGGPETEGLVDGSVLEALGPKGILVNVARGSVVNEKDLIDALIYKKIGGAGLDVFADEPFIPQPLIEMDNVVLSPHKGSDGFETRAAMGQLLVDNLAAHFEGKPLLTEVA